MASLALNRLSKDSHSLCFSGGFFTAPKAATTVPTKRICANDQITSSAPTPHAHNAVRQTDHEATRVAASLLTSRSQPYWLSTGIAVPSWLRIPALSIVTA